LCQIQGIASSVSIREQEIRKRLKHLVLIFDRLSCNLGATRSGFPDLILFPPDTAFYELVEVKSPNDQL